MAWVNPRTWIDGIRLSAAQMNQVSENLRQTAPAKAQAAGDLFFATARNAIARLAIGASGTFLRPGSNGLPEWGVVPTPITTRGDLVIGDASGNLTRIGVGDGVRVLAAEGGVASWKEEIFLHEWWKHSRWWIEDAGRDLSFSDAALIGESHLTARDITFTEAASIDNVDWGHSNHPGANHHFEW